MLPVQAESQHSSWQAYDADADRSLSADAEPYFPRGAIVDEHVAGGPGAWLLPPEGGGPSGDGPWQNGDEDAEQQAWHRPPGRVLELAAALQQPGAAAAAAAAAAASGGGCAGAAVEGELPGWGGGLAFDVSQGWRQASWAAAAGESFLGGPICAPKMGRGGDYLRNNVPHIPRPAHNKSARTCQQLRQLLDFYFEPFNMQHNRYLLNLIAQQLGQQDGPWLSHTLGSFSFTFEDLKGLGRVATALQKFRRQHPGDSIGTLKYLCWNSEGRLQLRSPPEVRAFVPAAAAAPAAVRAAVRYLAAVKEQQVPAPEGVFSVLYYALGDVLPDSTSSRRAQQLKRQLLLHRTDIICLQGFDLEAGVGEGPDHPGGGGGGGASSASLGEVLRQDGYASARSRREAGGRAITILWDTSRFEYLGREQVGGMSCDEVGNGGGGAALALNLRALQAHARVLRVACGRPAVPTTACAGPMAVIREDVEAGAPVVACVDLTELGGAESACIVEELTRLSSVSSDVLGEELATPLCAADLDGRCGPVVAAASRLNRLHRPDAMFAQGVEPLVALSGHTEAYLSTLSHEDVLQQFPAFRLPLVAAFRWEQRGPQAAA